VGSKVGAGQALTITAGQNIIAKAADLQAQGDVSIAAQGTVLLNAGQTRSSYDSVLSKSSSDLFSTTTSSTQTQASAATAQVSSVQGQNVSIKAGKDLISVGTQFKGTDSLRVEGQDTSTFYAATDVHQITTTTHTKTDLGAAFSAMLDPLGFGTPIEEKNVTDARATSTSIGTSLLSDKKIEIGVGNKTELQGTKVEAQQIAFNLTDPNKAGVLILGGSTDTTQTSHTEKSETLGLYQEMKGKGSTTETLNQTQLQGNVSFDNALKITVQIPDTKGGQELKSQINALVSQSGGTGLEYLNQLAADPNIQWDQIALANEKWSYDQAGDALAAKSRERDADLAKACSGATPGYCNDKKAEAIAMGNKVYTTEGGFVYANSPDKGAIQKLNIATIGGISRPQNFNDQLSQSTADALIQGTGTVALGGGVVRSAVVAFGIGAGFDAAGQYVQSGTIRPEQSVVAGTTAAVFAPLAARGNLWLPIAGASTAGLNTTFNNYFYDENTNAFVATGLGAAFGTVGPILGKTTQKWASPYITSTPYIPTSGSAYIPIAQPRWFTVPGYVGSTINSTVSNVPSFIPLDNGKPVQGSQP
jgi:hypothetical protein